jgi:ribose transport system permease protein
MASTARARLNYLLNLVGPFLGLLLVIGLFCVKPEVREGFLTGGNFKIIFTQTVIVASCALGMTMIIVSGGIDLSAGSVVALTSVLGAKLLETPPQSAATAIPPATVALVVIVAGGCIGLFKSAATAIPPATVALVVIVAGGCIGLFNGALIAGLRLLPFIVTLGMMSIARGAAKWLADNQAVNYNEKSPINEIMALNEPYKFLPLAPGVWVVIALAIVMAIVMRQTVFGRHIFAIGSNEATARLCGIRVPYMKVAIYGLAGLFFGLGGLLQLSRLNVGDPTVAVSLELDVIAAVVIGGASLSGGTGTILGSMIGALIMAVLRNGSNQMGWPSYIQEIIIGAVIVLAVGVDKLRQQRAT